MELSLLTNFKLDGKAVSIEPYGNGHINRTYLVKSEKGTPYILQRINDKIFPDVPALMRNIALVTAHLKRACGDPRRVLTIVEAVDGQPYYAAEGDGYYRVYVFVRDSLCLERADTAEAFYNSALAFGGFQRALSDFRADSLTEVLPRFHDTPHRYEQLHEAVKVNFGGRLAEVGEELDFALAREEEAGTMLRMRGAGALPLRVTHNDTKLNNVLLDRTTGKPLCVIDLDTVMPGLLANDFGDSIRFGASTAAEDETDLSLVTCSLSLFEAYTRGYFAACIGTMTENEIRTLPMGAKLMTLECGIRFLADYLNGDTYFRTSRERHNLIRCRTQFKLVRDMEEKWGAMNAIIERCALDAGRKLP